MKKANTLVEKVLSIVIAVLCIILLIWLAVRFYSIKKQDVEIARTNLENIKGKINYLSEHPETESLDYFITGPEGWSLVSFKGKGEDGEPRPLTCLESKGCLCMCPEISEYIFVFDEYKGLSLDSLQKCNEKGACQAFDYNAEVQIKESFAEESEGDRSKITFPKGGESIEIKRGGDGFFISRK